MYLCKNSTNFAALQQKNMYKIMTVQTKKILKVTISVLIAALTALAAGLGLNSCNVVRTITTKSEFYQHGDTSVMIQTKTTESYSAKKNFSN